MTGVGGIEDLSSGCTVDIDQGWSILPLAPLLMFWILYRLIDCLRVRKQCNLLAEFTFYDPSRPALRYY